MQEIEQAAEKLKEQKSVVQSYVMDEVFDKMGGGEAALAPYYVGDGVTMMADNPDLAMFIPAEGTNYLHRRHVHPQRQRGTKRPRKCSSTSCVKRRWRWPMRSTSAIPRRR